jgi:putative oxidoreductase
VILGLFGRLGPLAMGLLNAVAVISYAHVLFADGFEAAIAQHYLWGFMLLMLTIAGPGEWTVDRVLAARSRAKSRSF